MEKNNNLTTEVADRELVISRVINAPRELVFNAWIDPEQICKWWGPNGFTSTIHEYNLEPGGVWKMDMIGPDGTVYPNYIVFKEIISPEKLVYMNGHENDPFRFEMTVTFENKNGKTLVTIRQLHSSADSREVLIQKYGAKEGAIQHLANLDAYLSSIPAKGEFRIERTFNAPRDMVFRAWTMGHHMTKWWGPKGFEIKISKMDVKPGGTFLYSMTTPDGNEMWGKFVYHEIKSPDRLVFVNSFSDKDGNITPNPYTSVWPLEILNTLTFTEQDGKTILSMVGTPINASDEGIKAFEAAIGGMNQGFAGTFSQLDEYLDIVSKNTHNRQIEPLLIERIVNAPRELVFKAWTDPKMMAKWWSPKYFTNPRVELDVWPGGAIHVDMQGPDGVIYPMGGKFLEIEEPSRLVLNTTAIMNGVEILENRVTVSLEDMGNQTKLNLSVLVTRATPEAAGPLEGMDIGFIQTIDKLVDLFNN